MNLPVKYRIWDRDEGKYIVHEDALTFLMELALEDPDRASAIAYDGFRGDGDDDVRYVWEMYAGFSDSGGRPVYAGDVIEHRSFSPEEGETGVVWNVVRWDENTYDYGGQCHGFDVNGFWNDSFRVVGNIRENPEKANMYGVVRLKGDRRK